MITHAAPLPPDFYEKTLRNIVNLRQEHEHDATLHRFLGDIQALEATVRRLEANRDRCFREALPLAREAMGALTDEPAHVAAYRVVRERDEARAERDRALAATLEARNERDEAIKERDFARFHLASMEECFKVAQGKLATLLVERDAAVLHAGKCALNAGHIAEGNHARKRLRDEIAIAVQGEIARTNERLEALRKTAREAFERALKAGRT